MCIFKNKINNSHSEDILSIFGISKGIAIVQYWQMPLRNPKFVSTLFETSTIHNTAISRG